MLKDLQNTPPCTLRIFSFLIKILKTESVLGKFSSNNLKLGEFLITLYSICSRQLYPYRLVYNRPSGSNQKESR